MRKLLSLIAGLLLCLWVTVPVFAASAPRLVDEADLLSSSEESELLARLDEISARQNADIVIVTVNSLDGKTPMEYADDYYDTHGYNSNGILLLVSMDDRDYWMSTAGFGITAFTDAGMSYMQRKFVPSMTRGDYAEAFNTFASLCDEFLEEAHNGRPYDHGHMPKEKVGFFWLPLSGGIGAAISGIINGSKKSRLKSVHSKPDADAYIDVPNIRMNRSEDIFLYAHHEVVRTHSDDNGGSSTHISSSGVTHGGSGGNF